MGVFCSPVDMINQADTEEMEVLWEWLRSHITNGHIQNAAIVCGLNLSELQRLHRQLHEVGTCRLTRDN
jgi:hypothetical protein